MTALKLLISLLPMLPPLIRDIEAIAEAIRSNATLQQEITLAVQAARDIASALEQLVQPDTNTGASNG